MRNRSFMTRHRPVHAKKTMFEKERLNFREKTNIIKGKFQEQEAFLMTRTISSLLSLLIGASLAVWLMFSLSPSAQTIDLVNNIGLSSEFSEAVGSGE